MENNPNDIYYNFPIALIAGAHTDIKKVCNDIIDYVTYAKFLTLDLGNKNEKMKSAALYLGITLGSIDGTYKNGKILYDSLPTNWPMAGIKKRLVFEFRDALKTDFEIAVFCAYCGLRSILGKKSYVRTSNDFLKARMDGMSSKKDVVFAESNYYSNTFKGYKKFRKVTKALEQDWLLKYYAKGVNGFYVSFGLPLADLIYIAENNKQKNKDARQKQAESEALKTALERLKNKGKP